MLVATEDLSQFYSRLREPTPDNIHADTELVKAGILDPVSLITGYQYWRDPVKVEVHRADGSLKALRYSHNLRTNAGGVWQSQQMSGSSVTYPDARALWMALAQDAITPNPTDTFLGGTGGNPNTELTLLGRVTGTFTPANPTGSTPSTTNAGTYQLVGLWTVPNGQSYTAVNKCGIWTASSGGILVLENIFSPVPLGGGDSLTVTYQVTF